MNYILRRIDSIVRGASRDGLVERSHRQIIEQSAIIVLCTVIYGGVMGSWGLFDGSGEGSQWLYSLYSAMKVPLLLLASFLLSLPALFVFYTLAGLRSDFWEVARALTELQGVLAIILGGLAPFTLLWYASTSDYQQAILFNALMFGIATLAALIVARRHLPRAAASSLRHRMLLRLWIVIYIFIGVQMGWGLRPFIGNPGSEATFFREGGTDNAYVVVMEMILHQFSR